MGASASVSKNITNQLVQQAQNIANTYVSSCTTTVDNSSVFNFKDNCFFGNNRVDIVGKQLLNTSCIQNNTTKSTMNNDIQSQLHQSAQALVQNFGLGLNIADAEAISNSINNLSQTITSTYTQVCTSQIANNTAVNCSESANVSYNVITIDNTTDAYTSCTSNNITNSNAVNDLQTVIQQSSVAKQVDTFAVFVIVFFIFLAIIAIFFLYNLNGPIGWIIVIVVLVIVISAIIYSAFAFNNKNYPY